MTGPVHWGLCQAVDANGQLCALKAGHEGSHQASGMHPPSQVGRTGDDGYLYLPKNPQDRPPTLTQVYRGAQQADAVAAMRKDAEELAKWGYAPTSQSWAQGQWGGGAFLIAIVLMILLVGFLIFLYMLIVKPWGSLTVTYTKQGPPPAEPAAPSPVDRSLSGRLTQLDDARKTGLISDEEHAARRAKILDEI